MGEPFTYAYRYPAFPPEGATVIRFNHGEEVNGSKPIEAIPLYTRPSPSEDAVELVARALAKADGKDPDAPAWVKQPGNETFGICWRDQYSDKAKAAIAALSAMTSEPERLKRAREEYARLKGGDDTDHEAFEAALSAMTQGDEWQDIESAPPPFDTDVLVCVTHNVPGEGNDQRPSAGNGYVWETVSWVDSMFNDGNWFHWKDRIGIPFPPTHWRPLPAPPRQAAKDGRDGLVTFENNSGKSASQ